MSEANRTGAGHAPHPDEEGPSPGTSRRGFLATASTATLGVGLVASYGTFAGMAGRFLYPAQPPRTTWVFVTTVATLKAGESLTYRAPSGERITVTRRPGSADSSAFAALSSTCPHLGCQVHWEPQNQRFFCPCHNGAFDADGKATQGPPADAGQSLVAYPLKVEGGLLYLEVPVETLSPPVPRRTGTPRPGSRA